MTDLVAVEPGEKHPAGGDDRGRVSWRHLRPPGQVAIGAELGGRFGWARLKGESSDENVTTGRVKGGFGGPMLRLFISSSTNPYAVLTAELGYAFYGNIGHLETSRVIATTDIWISTGLAVGFGF